MKHFIDTEFIENAAGVKLISLGIASADGSTFYAESCDFDERQCDPWVKEHVLPGLQFWQKPPVLPSMKRVLMPNEKKYKSGETIVYGTENFIKEALLERFRLENDKDPMFYGYYSSYDWVVFARLFGRLIDLPKHFPMYCLDLKQMMVERGLDKDWKRKIHPDPEGEHNALIDALWNKLLFEKIVLATGTIDMAVRGALRDLHAAQDKMLQKWADGSEELRTQLWTDLHAAGNIAHEVLHYQS